MRFGEMMAVAHGERCAGDHRCIFCGSPAADPYTLPSSFTARDTLACPGDGHVCRGCDLALQESGEAVYPDGTTYWFTKAYRRMLSHVVTAGGVVQATKSHVGYLLGVCLTPPDPPFVVSLAVSGQKHVLYRGVVCRSREAVSVTLEGERVDYRPAELASRLALCGRVCAATGKPALAGSVGPSVWFRVCERYTGGEAVCSEWERVREEPLSRLAAFLTPAKADCEKEYLSDRAIAGDRHDRVPPSGGRPGRPRPADRGGRGGERQGGGEATLFGPV